MTDPRDNTFWDEMVGEMRRALHLCPLTDEEAEREYDEAPEVPLSEDQIAKYAKIAGSAVPRELSYEERTTSGETNKTIDQEVGEVRGLYRNEGDLDPDVEEEMRRQRKEALEGGEDQDDDDAESTEES